MAIGISESEQKRVTGFQAVPKGGYIGDYIGDYYEGFQGGYYEFRLYGFRGEDSGLKP